MSSTVLERLSAIGSRIKKDTEWRVREVRRSTEDREIDQLIKNHSISVAEFSRDLKVSTTWARNLMKKEIEEGNLPEVVQTANRYLLTLEHAHLLAELSGKAESCQKEILLKMSS